MHRTYVGRLERGESGVKVEALAAILAALDVFFKPFKDVVRPRTPRRLAGVGGALSSVVRASDF